MDGWMFIWVMNSFRDFGVRYLWQFHPSGSHLLDFIDRSSAGPLVNCPQDLETNLHMYFNWLSFSYSRCRDWTDDIVYPIKIILLQHTNQREYLLIVPFLSAAEDRIATMMRTNYSMSWTLEAVCTKSFF